MGRKVYNNLPSEITEATNSAMFKKKLKWLIEQAFYDHRDLLKSNAEEKVREVFNFIVQEKFPNAMDIKIKPISTEGANYSSVVFEGSIITPELFAKVVSMGDHQDVVNHVLKIEKFVLTAISSTFEKFQVKHGIQEKNTFPKFYTCPNEATTVVLENLASQGYKCYDRLKIIDWNYASKSVETLAKFHALSLAYKKEYPQEFKEAAEVLTMPLAIMTSIDAEGFTDGAMAAVDEEDKEDKEKLSQLLEGFIGLSKGFDLTEPRKTSVIVHDDYRASNLMHKEENGDYKVIPVDYQTARLGCPVADLIYFILMGTDQQFRKQHHHRLVDRYYKHLALMMTKLGLQPEEVYGREEFDGDLKAKLPIALSVAATVFPFVTVDPENAPNFERNEFVPRANELFNERFRGLVQDLKLWGVL